MTEKDLRKLEEQFIDKFGIVDVLETIVKICDLKADHIQENWGPPLNYGQLPKAWHKIGTAIVSIMPAVKKQQEITE